MMNKFFDSEFHNELGQPIGQSLTDWKSCIHPPKKVLSGKYCRVEPLGMDAHAANLYASFVGVENDSLWTYLPYGPYESFEPYREWVASVESSMDPLFFAVINAESDEAIGLASYLRIEPAVGAIEVGHINFSPQLRKTAAATESMFLMMQYVFDELGYRRYEWKCDALNAGSRAAAQRFGFSFEGIFRQATMYKGRNRDTAWFSILDSEWSKQKEAFEQWLEPNNFDENGHQRRRLQDFK